MAKVSEYWAAPFHTAHCEIDHHTVVVRDHCEEPVCSVWPPGRGDDDDVMAAELVASVVVAALNEKATREAADG